MNKYKYIFPLVLIGLDLCAGVVYLASGDIKNLYIGLRRRYLILRLRFKGGII